MAGRGRGYAARHKNKLILAEAAATVISNSPNTTLVMDKTKLDDMFKDGACEVDLDADIMKQLLHIEDSYKPMLAQLERITPGEDGIVFNRKLKDFETAIITKCSSDEEIRSAFASCRAWALRSEASCRRLSCVAAALSRSINPRNLRSAFLSVMQDTYNRLDILERSSPSLLINAANLLGDYYYEARLSDGGQISVIAGPLVGYLRSLLATPDAKAHRSLATQLMKIGRQLLSALPSEIDKLSIDIRCRILALAPSSSTVWLLLASDLCINKFLPLPASLEQFYTTHLDLTRDEPPENKINEDNCQKKPNDAYNEVSYGSWRNSPEEKFDNLPENTDKTESLYVDTSSVDGINDSIEHLNVSVANSSYDESLSNEIRKPRAILGAGARKSYTPQYTSESNSVELSANKDNDKSFWNANEFNRNSSELNRKSNEPSRRTNDLDTSIPKSNEISHRLNDSSHKSNELSHKTNDSSHKSYDVIHNTNESHRKTNDMTNKSNDSIRKTNDSIRRSTPLLRRYDLNSWRQDDTPIKNQYGEIETQNYTNDNSIDNNQRSVKYKEKCDRSSYGNEWRGDDKSSSNGSRRTSDGSIYNSTANQKHNTSSNSSNNWRNSSNNKEQSQTTEDYDWTETEEENVGNNDTWESENNDFEAKKKVVKKHVTDVPKGSKYWGHDDRLDHDYDS